MKKVLVGVLLFGLVFAIGDRHHDRDWTITKVEVKAATAKRVTPTQSGMLKVWNNGADAFIAINATANSTDIVIADKGSIDFYPAVINLPDADYFTVYSGVATSINYIILD